MPLTLKLEKLGPTLFSLIGSWFPLGKLCALREPSILSWRLSVIRPHNPVAVSSCLTFLTVPKRASRGPYWFPTKVRAQE